MSNEGGDDNLPAGVDAPVAAPSGEAPITFTLDVPREMLTPSETLTYAKPEEVVEFVERVRPRESQTQLTTHEAPTGNVTIVAVTPSTEPLTAVKCEWEQCQSPAVTRMRWRREKYNGRDDAFDNANYCDGHAQMSMQHGAVKVGAL